MRIPQCACDSPRVPRAPDLTVGRPFACCLAEPCASMGADPETHRTTTRPTSSQVREPCARLARLRHGQKTDLCAIYAPSMWRVAFAPIP